MVLLVIFSFQGNLWAAELKKMTTNIHWLGHDSFRIDGEGVVIYLDPYKLKEGPKADLILITHEHQDHASPADVSRIQKPDTVIVTIAKAAEKLSGEIKTVKPGDELTVKGVRIYHTGDSDFIPEMKRLAPDVALLPVSGIYVMTAEEAVEAAAAIQPKVALPMHVGEGIGSLADAQRFKEKAAVPVIVLSIEK